jgi:hypothetical protein
MERFPHANVRTGTRQSARAKHIEMALSRNPYATDNFTMDAKLYDKSDTDRVSRVVVPSPRWLHLVGR